MAITKPSVRSTWAQNAQAADSADPGDSYAATGWVSGTKPPRQYFNFILNWLWNGVRYFSRRGIPDYDVAETYQTGDVARGPDGVIRQSLQDNNIGNTPASSPTWWGSVSLVASSLPNAVTFNSGGNGAASGAAFNGSGGLTISYNTIGAVPLDGTGATGTWPNSINGNSATATHATSADATTKLSTARTIQTNLASTVVASFDGTANITPGVTGVLPVANGGTGSSAEKYLQLVGGTITGSLSITQSNGGIELGAPAASNTPFIDFHSSGSSNDYDVRLLASGGSSAIGNGKLTVTAAGGVALSNAATVGGTLAVSGAATFSSSLTATTLNASSDMRLKSRCGFVTEHPASPLDALVKNPPFVYTHKRDDLIHFGVSAQGFQSTAPEIVREIETNDPDLKAQGDTELTIDIYGYAALIHGAVVELAEQIKALRQDVEAIKARGQIGEP